MNTDSSKRLMMLWSMEASNLRAKKMVDLRSMDDDR